MTSTRLEPGDRVRVPDGREGKLLWIIPSGTEAAVALDGAPGTFHIHPSCLTRVLSVPVIPIDPAADRIVDALCAPSNARRVKLGVSLTEDQWAALQRACCHYTNETTGGESAPAWHALDALRRQAGLELLPREWPARHGEPPYPLYAAGPALDPEEWP